MGKRSKASRSWPKRHDTATHHTVQMWICADCRACGGQLIGCYDEQQRCPDCKGRFDRGERPVAPRFPLTALPSGTKGASRISAPRDAVAGVRAAETPLPPFPLRGPA